MSLTANSDLLFDGADWDFCDHLNASTTRSRRSRSKSSV